MGAAFRINLISLLTGLPKLGQKVRLAYMGDDDPAACLLCNGNNGLDRNIFRQLGTPFPLGMIVCPACRL